MAYIIAGLIAYVYGTFFYPYAPPPDAAKQLNKTLLWMNKCRFHLPECSSITLF